MPEPAAASTELVGAPVLWSIALLTIYVPPIGLAAVFDARGCFVGLLWSSLMLLLVATLLIFYGHLYCQH